MSQWMSTLIIIVAVLIMLIYIIFVLHAAWKERSSIKESVRRLTSFERTSLQVGLTLSLAISLIKNRSSENAYVVQMFLDLSSTLASVLFALGVLALLKHGHEIGRVRNQRQKKL